MKHYPAKISKRVWATVIDIIAVWIMSMFLGAALVPFTDILPLWLAVTGALLIFFLVMFYTPILETFNHGKTFGKALMGICVIRTDGTPASGVNCFQRYLMGFLDFGTLLGGFLCATITEKRQRFGDLIADTMVVDQIPQKATYPMLSMVYNTQLTDEEKAIYRDIDDPALAKYASDPLSLARRHRAIEYTIARLRTIKGHPVLIDHLERELSNTHIRMFKHKAYTLWEMIRFTISSIPRAVYESRWCIFASLAIAVVAYIIGIYSQYTDTDFFRQFIGDAYTDMSLQNIKSGNPMGVYGDSEEWSMFLRIFTNNLMVTLNLYVFGLITFIGPLMFLLQNFVMCSSFDAFFAQHGFLTDALISPNEHGVLELWSIIVAGGASIRLGSGWLFPGKLSRIKAWARGARQSMLMLLSTIPMLFVAAVIESFITRHTEWPMYIKLGIIIVSFIFILLYYVMLPILSKTR